MLCIALAVVERRHRTVDRQLMKIRPTKSADLRIGVGKQPTLQQRIVGEVDTRHDVARAEGDLLGFREEVVRVAVQGHFAQRRDRDDFFGNDLGRVEDVEVEVVFVLFFDDLHAQFPFRVVTHLDRFPQVATVVVGIFTGELLRLVPHQRAGAGSRAPVEFDEARFAFGIDQAEGVHAETLHAAQAFRDRPVGHRPDDHVRRFRHQRDEVPEGVVSRAAGRDFVVRLGFHRVYEVRKLDRVLNEEHRHVVADQVEVALVGKEFHRKAAHVTHGVAGTTWPLHGGKAHEHRGLLARIP